MRVLGLLLAACLGLSSVSAQVLNADATNTFHITGGSNTAAPVGYVFANGTASAINPTLNLTVGTTYYFSIEFVNNVHPFGLSTVGTGTAVAENGLVVNGTCTGTATAGYQSTSATAPFCVLAFTAPNSATGLWYHCAYHSNMVGQLQLNSATTTAPTTATPTTGAPTTPAPAGNGTTAPPTSPANTLNPDATNTFHVTGGSPTAGWTFAGATLPNPTLNMAYGKTYQISIEFDTTATGGNHPFVLSTSNTGPTAVTSSGLVNVNTTCGSTSGFTATAANPCVLSFTPPANTPQPLYYRCTVHAPMVGGIVVSGLPKGGAGFALVPGFAAFFAVIAGLFAQ